jgi:hypothetical protein
MAYWQFNGKGKAHAIGVAGNVDRSGKVSFLGSADLLTLI